MTGVEIIALVGAAIIVGFVVVMLVLELRKKPGG